MRKPRRPPDVNTLFESHATEFGGILRAVREPTHEGKYLHWEDLQHREPPEGLSREAWWFGLKWNRQSQYKAIPLKDADGAPFVYATPEASQRLLHEITRRASGSVGVSDQVTNEETRDRYLVRGLMEEGIASSILEGASTTREQAKVMLRSKREPKDLSERMILNNYAAMQYIIALGRSALSPEIVYQLHEIITQGTLDDPSAAGRPRRRDERIDIVDARDNEVLHIPPPAEELPARMAAMCDFANGKTPEGYVDPVVRSILLHFWLAYDHPFKDGNGRCARALFYWSMLTYDYWLCRFISISQSILKAPVQYARAFLFTESDGNDATYFLLHQLRVVERAIDGLHDYIDRKAAQRCELERRLRLGAVLNERQLELVGHALRHPNAQYDIAQHQTANGVVYQTARTDLLGLAEKGLFIKRKRGKAFYFHPAPDLEEVLKSLGIAE